MHLLKQHFLSQFSSCDPPISLMSSEEDGERIFPLLPLLPRSLLCTQFSTPTRGRLPASIWPQFALGSDLIIGMFTQTAARSARRLGLIPDLWNMERSGNEGGLSTQLL